MIKNLYHYKTILLFLGLLVSVKAEMNQEDYFSHLVKKGESVSLICIDYYGHYNSAMAEAVKKLNPSISDINVINTGDKLKFHKPQSASKKKETSQPIFEKRVNIIQGVVTCVDGYASLIRKGSDKKSELTTNTLVFPGDVIQTGADGRVEIIVNRESVTRMKENTRLTLGAFRDTEKNVAKTSFNLLGGVLWTKVKKFADKISRFELSLPTAIAGVHGTVYQTGVAQDSTAEIKVYSGEVAVKNKPDSQSASLAGELAEVPGPSEIPGPHEVTMEEWTHIIRSMQKITIGKDGTPSDVTSFQKDTSSSWEKWNEERDMRIAEMFSEK